MAEVQQSSPSGEMAQRFIELILMHTGQAAMFLGQTPNPTTGEKQVNLTLAKVFIDQLEVIQVKTKGNLNSDEAQLLESSLMNLRLGYLEAERNGEK